MKPGQIDRYNAAMEKMRLQQERDERKREAQPRTDFFAAGAKAGFTKEQVAFMWKWLAKEDHGHWNGRIG